MFFDFLWLFPNISPLYIIIYRHYNAYRHLAYSPYLICLLWWAHYCENLVTGLSIRLIIIVYKNDVSIPKALSNLNENSLIELFELITKNLILQISQQLENFLIWWKVCFEREMLFAKQAKWINRRLKRPEIATILTKSKHPTWLGDFPAMGRVLYVRVWSNFVTVHAEQERERAF